MKKLLLLFVLTISTIFADSGEQIKIIKKEILESLKIDVKEITLDEFKNISNIKLYKSSVSFEKKKGSMNSSFTMNHDIHAFYKNKAISLELPSSSEELVNFTKIIKKDFRIKKVEDALYFEKFIDKIFPKSSFFSQYKKPIKKDNNWILYRGTFFDHLSGLIITVDKSGKIIKIKRDLKIEKFR